MGRLGGWGQRGVSAQHCRGLGGGFAAARPEPGVHTRRGDGGHPEPRSGPGPEYVHRGGKLTLLSNQESLESRWLLCCAPLPQGLSGELLGKINEFKNFSSTLAK
jgi:hypothetical protein